MKRPEPGLAILTLQFWCSPIACGAVLLALSMAVTGCSRDRERRTEPIRQARSPASMPPEKIVLDYRYGWYHPATGSETISQIARDYDRDLHLVAGLNQTQLEARPYAGKMIYIPPNNDRDYVRQALVRINANPGIVPRTPWKPERASTPAEPLAPLALKQNETGLKTKVAASLKETPVTLTSSRGGRQLAISDLTREAPVSQGAPAAGKPERRIASPVIAGIVPLSATGSPPKPKSGASGFAWPLEGKVITAFSEGWTKACHGIEIAAAKGTQVRAARAGKVLLAQEFPGYGRLVLIDHGDGLASVYAYLETMKVREGTRVAQGDIVATSGSKNSSPLLFFQIRRRGVKVDPMEYLP